MNSTPIHTPSPHPLQDLAIVITRAPEQATDMVQQLQALGARPVLFPTVAFAPAALPSHWEDICNQLATYDWIVFTSTNAVFFLLERLKSQQLKQRQLVAVGPATAQALSRFGLSSSFLPQNHSAQGLIDAFQSLGIDGDRILLPRSDLARPDLPEGLKALGAIVDEVVVYQTVCPTNLEESQWFSTQLSNHLIDAIAFASPSSVINFQQRLENPPSPLHNLLEHVVLASLGAATTQALEQTFGRVDIQATQQTTSGLIEALSQYFQHYPNRRITHYDHKGQSPGERSPHPGEPTGRFTQ